MSSVQFPFRVLPAIVPAGSPYLAPVPAILLLAVLLLAAPLPFAQPASGAVSRVILPGPAAGANAVLRGTTALQSRNPPRGQTTSLDSGTTQTQDGGTFRAPVDGTVRVIRPFDPPATPYAAGHRGVDLAAGEGSTVRSAGAGIVTFAGVLAGRGVVAVTHRNGLRTTYEPLTVGVHQGATVNTGAVLGTVVGGHPGCGAGGCLHWGLLRGKTYLDPLTLLRSPAVRLLPLKPGDSAS